MSSHEGSGDFTPVRTFAQLAEAHARGERARDGWLVGAEYEKFGFVGGEPLRYRSRRGRPGIETLFAALEERGWEALRDRDVVVGMRRGKASIALEPGGQVELSGSPLPTVHEVVAEMTAYEADLEAVRSDVPVRWVWAGAQPVHANEALDFMPKRRYAFMRRYLPTRGRLALTMMQATSTVQANFDYDGERDMGRKLRVGMGLSSIVNAMFANSPLRDGKPSGFRSFRAMVWEETDPDRCGLLPWVFDGEAPTYERYAEWAARVPMFFILRGGELVEPGGMTFCDFMKGGLEGQEPTLEDWSLHLSTLFPEVRLKTYLEVRSADCVPPRLLPALPALWKGVLYDDVALDAAWDLVRKWTFGQRVDHRRAAAKHALAADTPQGYATRELARELIAIARFGLERQAKLRGHEPEGAFLDPLERLVDAGETLADRTLAWWNADERSPADILRHYDRDWLEVWG